MASNYATPSLQRHLLSLRAVGLVPDQHGIFTIPKDLPDLFKTAVQYLCDTSDEYDWKYREDAR